MEFHPHKYQQYAVNRLIQDDSIGLFLECGLGKTVITLTAIRELRLQWKVGRVLVVRRRKWRKPRGTTRRHSGTT